MLYTITKNIYESYQEQINEAVEYIDSNIKASGVIPPKQPNDEAFIKLINLRQLYTEAIAVKDGMITSSYPGINRFQRQQILDIPLAINAFTLTGQLTKRDFNGVNTAKPLYPLNWPSIKEDRVPIQKGIKKSEEYYPYKRATKIAKGDTGDNTFFATNGTKILFVRGTIKADAPRYAPQGILASKIATLVSPEHFSSERLMSNKFAASKRIDTYARSVADDSLYEEKTKYIEEEKKVFPGTGLIDEVCNFVNENDPNIENLGFSSATIDQNTHLSKIDFDRCFLSSPTDITKYEQDPVTSGLYHDEPHVKIDPAYIQEKLYARLKLSLLTEPLLRGLADKSFAPDDKEKKEAAITSCCERSAIALDLFLQHENLTQFLVKNPEILKQCVLEIEQYVEKHFEKADQEKILPALKERQVLIESRISNLISKEKGKEVNKQEVNVEKSSTVDKGNEMKSRLILYRFEDAMKTAGSVPELKDIVKQLKATPEYKTLQKDEGKVKKMFGIPTSSIRDFDKMVEKYRGSLQEGTKFPGAGL